MISDVLRNMSLFVDGTGYAGKVLELTPPKLTVKTEEYRAGGMDAPVDLDVGLEKLELDFTMGSVDAPILKRWGVIASPAIPISFRGALQSEDNTVKPIELQVRARITEVDWGTWKPGERAQTKYMVNARYYKATVDGETIHEIDIDRFVRIIDGVDQLEAQRAALGIGGAG